MKSKKEQGPKCERCEKKGENFHYELCEQCHALVNVGFTSDGCFDALQRRDERMQAIIEDARVVMSAIDRRGIKVKEYVVLRDAIVLASQQHEKRWKEQILEEEEKSLARVRRLYGVSK